MGTAERHYTRRKTGALGPGPSRKWKVSGSTLSCYSGLLPPRDMRNALICLANSA